MQQFRERLNICLETMDIPAFRRDTNNVSNLRWLGRNLFIRNRNHPRFEEALRMIRVLGGI